MSDVKVELNYAGFNELRKSSEMQEIVGGLAKNIAEKCGKGYGSDVKQMGTRVVASVHTESIKAALDNNRNNTILKKMGG